MSLERLSWNDLSGEVKYSVRQGSAFNGAKSCERFDPLELLARAIMHIPEPRQHATRFYGEYSSVVRAKRRGDAAELQGAPKDGGDLHSPEERRRMRRSWAKLIKRVYEVDPLVCPECGTQMRIIAFILDHVAIDGILSHITREGNVSGRGPPEIAA